jgi:hypothetical protein
MAQGKGFDLGQVASPARLCVVEGSAHLRKQEERHARSKSRLGWTLLMFTAVVMSLAIAVLILQLSGAIQWGLPGMAATSALIVVLSPLTPHVERLRRAQKDYERGRLGEGKAAELLTQRLDSQWMLFRNLCLPDGGGDIDAVLTGPGGIFVLEIKAYSGRCRVEGNRWCRKVAGTWRPADGNPTFQARQNAMRLRRYLEEQGMTSGWVESRVMWAGEHSLSIIKPDVIIWQMTHPDRIVADASRRRRIAPANLTRVNVLLTQLASSMRDSDQHKRQ